MKKVYIPDETDKKIIDMLKENARLQWREIGEEVHISGQAVGERVKRLVSNKIITGFHASIDDQAFGKKRVDFITVIMTTSDHSKFMEVVSGIEEIKEVYRISGNGCYMMKVESNDQEDLNQILEKLLAFSNYSINSVVKQMK
ncbi:Lrp/AsnC family transcriptional regulator [Acidaminobacter sp. JC074]|uniref:Lrp/AsnC family transcriptional regulator n=1 Tax=Acidaminobacter sp. JC074 TaxID=2530199 RepID=UPI001F104305|nr:Lrp/AsnC family transcriptional regulator [Acidaminobacter sp. JC074]MCH4890052.1 Lrp/AsnC family transcriptional regulator [Acidaminobacter sp. JC074]